MTTHYGDLIGLRRPTSGYGDLRTIFYIRPVWIPPARPTVTPAPDLGRGWDWTCVRWTPVDLLLLPLALLLAAGRPGVHRRTPAPAGRHRVQAVPTRTRTTRTTGGTTR